MDLAAAPLTNGLLDDVIAFLRAANPFSQHTWGWDTGRFVDWRWGFNAVREAARPGWLADHCTVFCHGGDVVAVVISENGEPQHCILTAGEEPDLVAGIVDPMLTSHDAQSGLLRFTFSERARWLQTVFEERGFAAHRGTTYEWEFDLADLPGAAQLPQGFVVGPVATDRDYAGISACLQRAFGSEADRVPALRSLETNPMFRRELSIVARSPEGHIAAYCRGTVDPVSGVCGIDPVVTDPDYQRMGLGRAIVLGCFHAQRRLGGSRCYIGSAPDPAPGTHLYRSLGPSDRVVYDTWSPAPGVAN